MNSTQRITNWYNNELWEKRGKKNIQFALDNIQELKIFLNKKKCQFNSSFIPLAI